MRVRRAQARREAHRLSEPLALAPRQIDALLHADEPEGHGDDGDEETLRQKIEAEREMQEAEAIEQRRGGDGEKDGEQRRDSSATARISVCS